MNELKVFSNTEFGDFGIMLIDGKEYFPATQCARLLGYKDTINAVKQHCKGRVVKYHLPTNGGIQMVNYISESDLYRLIVKSKLPQAEKFERWVFDEVLPSIRKNGNYTTDMEALIMQTATAVVSELMKQFLPLITNKISEQYIPDEEIWEVPPRRIRKDCGIISRLDRQLRNEVDDMLLSQQYTYEEIRIWLLKQGVRISKSSIARRYRKLLDI